METTTTASPRPANRWKDSWDSFTNILPIDTDEEREFYRKNPGNFSIPDGLSLDADIFR